VGYCLLAGGVVLAADVGETLRASASDQLAAYRWKGLMGGAASTLQPRSNQASRSYHSDGAKNRGCIGAERIAPDDDPEKQ
jgi:hypothetical protein